MKKIGKKLSYFMKLFLAFALLFSNVSSFGVVLAEGLTDETGEVTKVDEENPEEPKENEQVAGDEVPTTGDETVTGETGTNETPTTDETTGNDEPTGGDTTTVTNEGQLEFTATLNENNEVVVKYSKALELTEGELKIDEDLTYVSGATHGIVNNTITLTDEVKTALSNGEYVYASKVLDGNLFDGAYVANVTIGEDTKTVEKTISQEVGVKYTVYNGNTELTEQGGIYVIPTDATMVTVDAVLLPGGISPSDTATLYGTEYLAEDLFTPIRVGEFELEGRLYGEFTKEIALEVGTTDYSRQLNFSFGTYQDNTDKLNEAVKELGYDPLYVFYSNEIDGILYASTYDADKLADIVNEAFGDSEFIYPEIYEDEVFLQDDNGTIAYYDISWLDEDGKIQVKLGLENDTVTSGDEFEATYVVTLKELMVNGISGVIEYDEDLLELVSVDSTEFTGGEVEGEFLYLGTAGLMGTVTTDDEGNEEITEEEYVLLTITFKAKAAGTATIKVTDGKFYNEYVYYEAEEEPTTEVTILASEDAGLASLTIAGQEISLEDGKYEYEINVSNDVTGADVQAVLANDSAKITSMVYPEELAEGENVVTITVEAADGTTQEYTIKVIREASSESSNEETTVTPMAYSNDDYGNNDNNDDKQEVQPIPDTEPVPDTDTDTDNEKDNKGNLQRIIIIGLILLVIAGLIYLIFKDDKDDEETKKANKDINKFKKEDIDETPKK